MSCKVQNLCILTVLYLVSEDNGNKKVPVKLMNSSGWHVKVKEHIVKIGRKVR